MKQKRHYLYEGIYIINATLSDDARNKALEKIKEGITSKGGEIHKIHEQGRRKLAYTIADRREGYYYIIYFTVESAVINDLWREYHLHEDLIRFITKRTDKVQEEIKQRQLAESA